MQDKVKNPVKKSSFVGAPFNIVEDDRCLNNSIESVKPFDKNKSRILLNSISISMNYFKVVFLSETWLIRTWLEHWRGEYWINVASMRK